MSKLNIYDFLVPETAEHCKKLGHTFNSVEMAVIVANSGRPIKDKLAAWQAIVDECPDMSVRESSCFKATDSLHDFLKGLIADYKKSIEDFYSTSENIVFQPLLHVKESVEEYGIGCFTTPQKALEAARKYIKENSEYLSIETEIKITKETMDKLDDDPPSIYVALDGELSGISYHYGLEKNDIGNIFFHLPTPFEEGDIVTERGDRPYVLVGLPYTFKHYQDQVDGKFNSDSSDMCGLAYTFYESGSGDGKFIEHDHPSLFHMRYYRGELKGRDRFLKDWGRCIKVAKAEGNGSLDFMLITSLLKHMTDGEAEFRNRNYYEPFYNPEVKAEP